MNKLTCRGCGKELDNCTCDVLTIKKEPTYILKPVKNNPYIKMAQESEKEWLGGWSTKRNNYSREKNGYARGVDNQLETDQLIVDKLQAERDAAIYKVGRLSRELGVQDFRIKDLERINEAHRIENGKLQERITELQELLDVMQKLNISATAEITLLKQQLDNMPTKDEAEAYLHVVGIYNVIVLRGVHPLAYLCNSKPQKIAGGR